MNHTAVENNITQYEHEMEYAHEQELTVPVVLGETNSDSANLNMSQVEEVLGSALWLIDHLMMGMTMVGYQPPSDHEHNHFDCFHLVLQLEFKSPTDDMNRTLPVTTSSKAPCLVTRLGFPFPPRVESLTSVLLCRGKSLSRTPSAIIPMSRSKPPSTSPSLGICRPTRSTRVVDSPSMPPSILTSGTRRATSPDPVRRSC